MMENQNKEIALSLTQLLKEDTYIIPIYQRNYAWGKVEISQLIRDISEFFECENTDNKNYYVGALVCFKREDGSFELIDGQQRHTTISLINVVLKNWVKNNEKIENTVASTNLKFDLRKNIQRFLEEIYTTPNFDSYISNSNIAGTQNFIDAITFIKEEFITQGFEVEKFADNFYNRVKFFRTEVPQDTDLNHYFEIMNNRGEQLEKHEIVKAHLMSTITIVDGDETLKKKKQSVFAKIWDACSNMDDYIYFNFDKDNREQLFKEALKEPKDNLEFYLSSIDSKTDESTLIDSKQSEATSNLLYIIENHKLLPGFSQELKTAKEKYKSVIDFPNFLLQVLKIKNENVSLDDKKLLSEFVDKHNDKKININALGFVCDLLKYRILFDKYIIKQDLTDADGEKQNWGIRKMKFGDKEINDNNSIIKTFDIDDDELVKLQTMLYYSNPSNTNNNWVQEILKFGQPKELESFTTRIFEIAKGRFDKEKLTYPEVTIFNLYFIDFLLWKIYKEKVQGSTVNAIGSLESKIYELKDKFYTFKFRQINSKEHLFPQASVQDITPELLNGIGNLCLISTSQNSEGNKENPSDKKKRFENDNSSLKRLIMFKSFKDETWGKNEIEEHEKEILALIENYLGSNP